VRPGYKKVASRLYQQHSRVQQLPRAEDAILGDLHRGFEVANTWLGATRLQVAATCLGRAERALELSTQWRWTSAVRQQIGKFKESASKLADMAVELRPPNS